jgi:hypothetical protein
MTSSTFSGPIHDEDNSTFVVKVYRSDQSFKYFPVLKVRINFYLKSFFMMFFLEYNRETSCYVSYN